jgi:hypothetical protein
VEAICGAFMLVRTAAARSVGGLPDDVFMYHEDIAFCSRVRKAGWRIRYRGEVSTLHRWRGSSRKSTADLALLEGVYKLQLIRDEQGVMAAYAGRVLFGIRCLLRLAIATVGILLPPAVRRRQPRVFAARTHALQLAWTVAPWLVRRRVPRHATAPVIMPAARRLA